MRQEMRVRQDDTHVLLITGGTAVADMSWEAALELSKAIYIKAKEAEEIAKAAGIINDQALLIRTGAPFGLSSNPDIQSEAAKEAAWNGGLRRYLPGGVKSREAFGRPAVVHGRPRGG